jgi:hypothetical protein
MSAGYRVTIVLDVYAHGCYRATVWERIGLHRSLCSEYSLGCHGVRGACPAEVTP